MKLAMLFCFFAWAICFFLMGEAAVNIFEYITFAFLGITFAMFMCAAAICDAIKTKKVSPD